jgi:hypothetical protein
MLGGHCSASSICRPNASTRNVSRCAYYRIVGEQSEWRQLWSVTTEYYPKAMDALQPIKAALTAALVSDS